MVPQMQQIAALPWFLDVNLHAAYIEQASHDILKEHFAVKVDGPRSSYISDEVWQLRTQRNSLKAGTRFWKEGHRVALLKEGLSRLAGKPGSRWWLKVDLLYNIFAAAIRYSTGHIKAQIRTDKQIILKRIVDGQDGHSIQNIQKALRRCGLGRRCLNKGGRPVPFLIGSTGKPIASRHELDMHWLEHFGQIEAGHVVNMQQFARLVGDFRQDHSVEIDFSLIPSFLDVELQFRRVRCGAAAGLDGLPPELFKAAPQVMAGIFHPLMVKAALHVAQPIQWRGGILFEAFKNSGSPSLAENYRSLFVSSVPGKCFHRILRDRAADVIEGTLDPLHCGGRKQRPVTLPSLAAHVGTSSSAKTL